MVRTFNKELRVDGIRREEFIKILRVLGLNSYKAKVYLALLLDRVTRPSEIYKKAEIPQARVYDTLVNLENKGYVRKSNNTYIPVNLSDMISKQQMKEIQLKIEKQIVETSKKLEKLTTSIAIINSMQAYIDALRKIYVENYQKEKKINKERERIITLKGNEAISKALISFFSKAKNKIINVDKNPPFILYPAEPIFEEVSNALKRGVQYSRVISLDYLLGQGLKNAKTDLRTGINIRVLPDSEIPSKLYIFDDRTTLIRIDEKDEKGAIILDGEGIIKVLKYSFISLWGKGIELKEILTKIKAMQLPLSLTREKFQIYKYLLEHGRSSILEISRGLNINETKCSKFLTYMCKRKLIEPVTLINKYKIALTDFIEKIL